jgi:hypothetical protein
MEREMADQPDFREALSEAVTAMFSAVVALKSGDTETAMRLLEAAHERGGEMLIETE